MFTILIVGCAVFGLAVGSFLNVVIYRVPRNKSIVSPSSTCPSCSTPIANRDNIPVVSWVVLRGRCRTCHVRISAQYPLVELLTAALFAGAAARIGVNWALPAFLFLLAGLVALSWIDVERLILPRAIVYPTLGLVFASLLLATIATSQWHRLLIAVICAVSWFVVFAALNLVSPRHLGFGDVRLVPLLGLSLGWLGIRYVILGFFLSNLVGAILGIALIATRKMTRDQQIPYGIFLASGTALAIYAGPFLLEPFQRFS